MKELTERAKRNIAAGAMAGPGTLVCVVCGKAKEETRLNSASCRTCSPPPAAVETRRKITTVVPAEVYAALAAEAARHNQTPEERITFLLTKKYSKPAPD